MQHPCPELPPTWTRTHCGVLCQGKLHLVLLAQSFDSTEFAVRGEFKVVQWKYWDSPQHALCSLSSTDACCALCYLNGQFTQIVPFLNIQKEVVSKRPCHGEVCITGTNAAISERCISKPQSADGYRSSWQVTVGAVPLMTTWGCSNCESIPTEFQSLQLISPFLRETVTNLFTFFQGNTLCVFEGVARITMNQSHNPFFFARCWLTSRGVEPCHEASSLDRHLHQLTIKKPMYLHTFSKIRSSLFLCLS